MKKLMEKFDVKTIVTIVIIAAMTGVGVYRMEYDWCENMSAVIWLVGELMIVAALTFKDIIKFITSEVYVIYTKMLED